MTLTCVAPSVPAASYTWKINGTDTNVKTAVYPIPSVSYTDSGTYTCVAYNIITGKTTTITHQLSVKGKLQIRSLNECTDCSCTSSEQRNLQEPIQRSPLSLHLQILGYN